MFGVAADPAVPVTDCVADGARVPEATASVDTGWATVSPWAGPAATGDADASPPEPTAADGTAAIAEEPAPGSAVDAPAET